ncbi:hypothetical protein ACYPKM_01535 [Pseudomonas aeruginosa]
MTMLSDSFDNSLVNHRDFFTVIRQSLERGKSKYGSMRVSFEPLNGIIDGALFTILTQGSDTLDPLTVKVWIGVNGSQIYYVSELAEAPNICKNALGQVPLLGQPLGWSFTQQPLAGIQSTELSGICHSDSLVVDRPRKGMVEELSRQGRIHAVDVARLMQAQVRCMEQNLIKCVEADPEPL